MMISWLFLVLALYTAITNAKVLSSNAPFHQDGKLVQPMNVYGQFPANPTYGIFSGYVDSTCESLSLVVSHILDTCISNGNTSLIVSCTSQGATHTAFSDPNCTVENAIGSIYPDCTFNTGSGSSAYLKMTDCGATNPMHYESGNYVVQTFHEDSSCANQVVTTIGSVTDVCYVNGLSGSYSEKWPYQYDYTDSLCTDNPVTTVNYQSLGCSLQIEDDTVYGFDSYVSYSHVVISSSDDDGLTEGDIVGLVIGTVVMVLGIVFGAVVYFQKKPEPMSDKQDAV